MPGCATRLRLDQTDRLKLAIVSIDLSRSPGGGALLGDRIRMNAIEHERIDMRSLATRDTGTEVSTALPEVIAACKALGGRLRAAGRIESVNDLSCTGAVGRRPHDAPAGTPRHRRRGLLSWDQQTC
jgi:hypothetical protein